MTTTKYTCLTFIPKNLFWQFSKLANAYFLFLVLLQLVPDIGQPNGSLMTAMPLCIVVSISMIKDLVEDNSRRKQDNQENDAAVEAAPRGAT